ncbi:MAG: hypothetical protein EOP48_16300 [Sphingobacteriales bacterium]|nr:MAG: hypothetical protein EOP48_16300 [Sphingobacteriales bacterium]
MKKMLILYNIGRWSALLAFISIIAFSLVQFLQLYDLLTFPEDERSIYGTSLMIVIPFVVSMHILHYTTSQPKRFFTHLGITFATMYAVFVSANYVVQLATVIPNALIGKIDEVRLIQQTPHSMFWDFDAIGYICMGFSMLSAAPALEKTGFARITKIMFMANAAVIPLIAIVYFYPEYSHHLFLLGLPWALTAPAAMLTLALTFNRQRKNTVRLNTVNQTPV